MGNCLRHESSMEWGGEDWGSPTAVTYQRRSEMSKKDMMAMDIEEGHTSSNHDSCGNNSTEVKIKITKRQLEELLGKVDVKGITVQQMLAELVSVSSSSCRTHESRAWQPALQSIPEGN